MEKYKLQYHKLIENFDNKEIKDYYKVLDLGIKGFNQIQIKDKIKISKYKIYNWLVRKTKPIEVRRYELFKEKDYFNEDFLNQNLEWLAYLVGYNLGDGNISKDLTKVWFYDVDSDLEKIRKILLRFKVNPKIYTYKINNGKMVVSDVIFSRFLSSFGAIKGNKTKASFEVPLWILNSGKCSILKKRFLQGLSDSELSKISQLKHTRFAFQSLKFYTVKEVVNLNKGIVYLDQLRELLSEFGVTTNGVKRDREYEGRKGSRMIQLYFVIHSNYINLDCFLDKIGFLFTTKRILDNETKLKIKSLAEYEKEKIKKYHKLLELRKKGLSAYKIAKQLDLPIHYAKSWLYKNRKPRSLAY